ncbi:folylpolyglutamate synthase/dihydrofolate synthase family protein [Limibacter armeniacum]|uniref:bifunctional folylpolyglutamate synthase/dihydrofolate synthase n=1 Tax=Limibacter armeniacum TaxID=466084 RepID=UPI002FE51679
MTYEQALDYMYNQLPMFQRVGAAALKKDLSNTIALCHALDNPHNKFKSIHIAGTNGKGSSSHFTAAILQAAGYKVGLYTSPHLKSFTERIRINGESIPEDKVIAFVEKNQQTLEQIKPSFFEMTVAMAFNHFAEEKVDYAVIEVGLGGRLDSTNIITPEACLITNISMDHTDILGDTIQAIAAEKAGIIKQHIPVAISESQEEIRALFEEKATSLQADIAFASDYYSLTKTDALNEVSIQKENIPFLEKVTLGLSGYYQYKNVLGVLQLIEMLNPKLPTPITLEHIRTGFSEVVSLTGIKGRWQQISTQPTIICDVGHNEGGLTYILEQLNHQEFEHLHMVLGVVIEKDLKKVLPLFPKDATYYFCKPNVPRGLDAEVLQKAATQHGLSGIVIPDVNQAIEAAKQHANPQDLIFIGGSTFVVAEVNEL